MEEKDLNLPQNDNIATQGEVNESNAAKRLRMLGIENDDRIHDEEAAIKKGAFFGNLWYQHKWGIIIGSILFITLAILIISIVTKPKYDMFVAYAGPLYVDSETKDAIELAFLEIAKDYDGNGEKLLNFASTTYQNPNQTEKNPDEIKQSYGEVLQANENNKALETIRFQLLSGTVAIYLMDETLYKEYQANMLNLNELTDVELDPSVMAGESGVYFKKTDFYSHMSTSEKGKALKKLPDDTVLCILPRLQTMDKELHESSKDLIKSILEFETEK